MTAALILFPHQLFRDNAILAHGKHVVLIEHPLYFQQYRFHKHKLILHRASMRAHAAFLQEKKIKIDYIDTAECCALGDLQKIVKQLQARGIECIHYIDPVDDWLERDLEQATSIKNVSLVKHPTPMFITQCEHLDALFNSGKRSSMAAFYAAQRKRLKILMEGNGPVGGRWSFDIQNRKRFPKNLELPTPWTPPDNVFSVEAREYVDRLFPDHPGEVDSFNYAVTYTDADRWLEDFLDHRFASFGPYEDAIVSQSAVLFHSNISHALNIGLLTPDTLLSRIIDYANAIPLNSLEGYVRQVLGWREYMRAAYVLRGKQLRSRNYWHHQRSLPNTFYTGATGIVPVDAVIRRVLKHAYTHHIERLMILANFMQLCEIDPDQVYRWFMELFIDAYDWVMVPNVYAMALYADGGTMTTKPYISSSNYVLKMSDFKRGEWCATWDALFWNFVFKHKDFFASNPRLSLLVKQLERISSADLSQHRLRATQFLRELSK